MSEPYHEIARIISVRMQCSRILGLCDRLTEPGGQVAASARNNAIRTSECLIDSLWQTKQQHERLDKLEADIRRLVPSDKGATE